MTQKSESNSGEYIMFGPCPHCQRLVKVQDRGSFPKNRSQYAAHVRECKKQVEAKQKEESRKQGKLRGQKAKENLDEETKLKEKWRQEHSAKKENQKEGYRKRAEKQKETIREKKRLQYTPSRGDFGEATDPIGILDAVISKNTAIAAGHPDHAKEIRTIRKRTSSIVNKIRSRRQKEFKNPQPSFTTPVASNLLQEFGVEEGTLVVDEVYEEPVSEKSMEERIKILAERRAREIVEEEKRKIDGVVPNVPKDAVETDFLLSQVPVTDDAPLTEEVEETGDTNSGQSQTLAELSPSQRARVLVERGFVFKDRASIMRNLGDFKGAVRFFMSQNEFEAIYSLYQIYIQTFIEWSGGYGLDAHKKKVFMQETLKIDRTFRFLRGEARRKKEFRDLRRFVDTNIVPRITGITWAVMLDTASKREEDKQEVKLKKAEAFVGAGEAGEGLYDLTEDDENENEDETRKSVY